jgi:hypothetical protein
LGQWRGFGKERAEKVLWCYAQAEPLARQGLWTVAVDEIPNYQVLERDPIRRALPGFIEQQEFEYTRHGTVNVLLFLMVHTGHMEVAVKAKKDAPHYIRELKAFHHRQRGLKGLFWFRTATRVTRPGRRRRTGPKSGVGGVRASLRRMPRG